jgi:hypothetical protein
MARGWWAAAVLGVLVAGCATPAPWVQPGLPSYTVALTVDHGLPHVSVTLGGVPYALMLDLGDGRALTLGPEVVAAVAPRFTARTQTRTNAVGHRMVARELVVEEARLGPRAYRGVVGFEHVLDPRYPSPNRLGTVGRALFGPDAALWVDLPRGELRVLTREDAAALKVGLTCLPMELGGSGIVTELETDAGPMRVVWDTGAQASLLRAPDASPDARPPAVTRTLTLGPKVQVRFTPYPFEEPPVDGYLGFDFFMAHPVLFDLGARCVAIGAGP